MAYRSHLDRKKSRALWVVATSLLLSGSAFAQKVDVDAPADDFGPEKSQERLPYSANDGAAQAHDVTLDSYSSFKHRVTYADNDLYTRANGLPPVSISRGEYLEYRFPDYPVARVTWQRSRDFCSWVVRAASCG